MYSRYVKLRDKKGARDADVASATGIGKSTFTDWKQGRSVPKQEKLDRPKELYLNGLISIDEYKADKERFEAQLTQLDQPEQGQTDLEALKQMLGTTFKSFYATMTPDEKQFLWRSIIKTIVPHRVKPLSRTIVCDVEFL